MSESRPNEIPEWQQKVLDAKREKYKADIQVENVEASVAALVDQGARPSRIELEEDRLEFAKANQAKYAARVERAKEVCAQKDAEEEAREVDHLANI